MSCRVPIVLAAAVSFSLSAVSVPTLLAQDTPAAPRAPAAGPGEIRGRITEIGSGRSITSGSITVRRGRDSVFVDGLAPGHYSIRIRALGFAPFVRAVEVTAQQPVVDLGTIVVSPVAAQLAGQQILAEREEVTLAPDRNSYSTKNMTTASGGTAIDVLRNVPSVEVDGTNNVSLRGNANVVVQINGRSSPLKGEQLGNFLAQLPASAVKNIEVATNPSAKNDPEGTAGIINIVLNQEAELGLSGGVTAGTGTTGMVNLSGNVGKQTGPFTLLVSGSVYRDRRVNTGTLSRTNLLTPIPAFVESSTDGLFSPRSGGATLRSEYRFSKIDALSFDAMAYGGRYGGVNTSHFTDLDPARTVIGLFDQTNDNRNNNTSQDYTAAFRRTGGPKATTFSTELRYSNNVSDNHTGLDALLLLADPSTSSIMLPKEQDVDAGRYPSWNLQTDYTHPFPSGTKLESGFKGTDRHTANDFTAAYLDSASGQFLPAPSRATAFDYRERIGAVYAVVSQQLQKAQLQAGLRVEEAATKLDLPIASQGYDKHYASLFPSAIVSYNLSELRQAKVSYSRRISRPNPYQLSPIENRSTARQVFRGNPALRPEYTDALELGLQDARAWGSLQVNPYLRRTTNAVRYIQSVDTAGISLGTFDNVASTTVVGTDLNVNYHTGPITLFGGGSVYRYSSDASNLARNLSTTAVNWSARANATYKVSPTVDGQFFANYRAPSVTEGMRQTAFVFMNAAVRYKRWGDQGNLSLRVADPFNLMKFGYRSTSPYAVEVSERHFGQRGVFLTVTRNFGQQLKLRPRQDEPQPTSAPIPGGP
jgi:ferric enterobactin receptor